MSVQYDFRPGLDLSSLASATGVQVQQAITQIAPLSNIGGILFGPVASFGAPFISDNPRCARYLLVDTTGGAGNYVVKYWDTGTSAWVAGTSSTDSIDGDVAIQDLTVTLAKLAATGGTAGQMIRVQADPADGFEFVSPANIIPASTLPITSIAATVSENDKFMRVSAGVASWQTYNPALVITGLNPNQLAPGSANGFLTTKSDGTAAEWVTDAFAPLNQQAGTLNLAKLAPGASAGNLLKMSGGVWVDSTPTINVFGAVTEYYQDAVMAATAEQKSVTSAFSACPKMWRVVLYCYEADTTGTGTGWVAGDEAGLDMLLDDATATVKAIAYYDSADKIIKVSHPTVNRIQHKTTGAACTFTASKWRYRARYIA